MMSLYNKQSLLRIAFLAISISGIAGCKQDTPPPSAPGYYNGDMKAKSNAKSDASGPSDAKNQAGSP